MSYCYTRVVYSLLFFILMKHAAPIVGAESIRVVGPFYQGFLEAPKIGVLSEIHQNIFDHANLSGVLEVYPALRSRHIFYGQKADAIFAIYSDRSRPIPVIYSEPFGRVDYYLYVNKSEFLLRISSSLREKVIGLVHGYNYSERLLKKLKELGVKVSYASSQRASLLMLAGNRIDGLIGSSYEISALTKELGVAMPAHDIRKPIDTNYFVYGLHSTREGFILERRISSSIRYLKEAGKLSDLYEKHIDADESSSD